MFNPVGEESPKIGVKPSSDPFLPDAPEIVNIKKEQVAQEPDPFNVAALLNTGGDTTSKRGLNLFQRVTGIGKRSKKVGVESEEGEKNPNDVPTNSDKISSSNVTKETYAITNETAEVDGTSQKRVDDAALDIPAFLRRSNN